jgi:hypothetical protein
VGVFTSLSFIRYASTSYLPALVTTILSENIYHSYPFYEIIHSKEKPHGLARGVFQGSLSLNLHRIVGSPFRDRISISHFIENAKLFMRYPQEKYLSLFGDIDTKHDGTDS